MRIDFIDLAKQINQNKNRGAVTNKQSLKRLENANPSTRIHTNVEYKTPTPKLAPTSTPHLNNKLNNKQITLYIAFATHISLSLAHLPIMFSACTVTYYEFSSNVFCIWKTLQPYMPFIHFGFEHIQFSQRSFISTFALISFGFVGKSVFPFRSFCQHFNMVKVFDVYFELTTAKTKRDEKEHTPLTTSLKSQQQ